MYAIRPSRAALLNVSPAEILGAVLAVHFHIEEPHGRIDAAVIHPRDQAIDWCLQVVLNQRCAPVRRSFGTVKRLRFLRSMNITGLSVGKLLLVNLVDKSNVLRWNAPLLGGYHAFPANDENQKPNR